MGKVLRVAAALLFIASSVRAASWPTFDSEDWIETPEAYFSTAEERAEWKTVDSREGRAAFQARYWLKRDPTPGTERNEFKELVLARIRAADDRFRLEKHPGSRTARGFVFILFGSPARVQDTHATAPEAPTFPPRPTGPMEGNETMSLWIYDKERTPRILEALERPSLEIEVIVEPTRQTDAVQSPGLVKQLQEKLAKKSIVNPDLIPSGPVESAGAAGAPPVAPPPAAPPVAPAPALAPPPVSAPLDAAVRPVLEKAPNSTRSGDTVFGDAVLWHDTGGAEALVWFYLPATAGAGTERRQLHGLVRTEGGGEEVSSFSESVVTSEAFSSAAPGEVAVRRLSLPPGTYDGAFAVTEGGGTKVVASAATKLTIPNLDAGFSISPLLLSRGQGSLNPGDEALPFAVGHSVLPPGADAVFTASETLWFFLEMANPPDPAKVTLEVRLRRGAETVRSHAATPAKLDVFSGNRSFCGFGLPLKGLSPGDYRLYVLVRDGVLPPDKYVLRSADFRIPA